MLYPKIFKLKDKSFIKFKWIGWPGFIPRNEKEKELIIKILRPYNIYPVWLEQEELDDFLLFIEQFLVPMFHNFKGMDENDIYE